MAFPPVPLYPTAVDSNRTLFLVYDTSEAQLAVDNMPWTQEISIVPVGDDEPEIWADNGFANLNGELLYYDSVTKNGAGKVNKFKRCARNLTGKTKFNASGSWIRGFVVAEHHNQLAQATINTERFLKDVESRILELLDIPDCDDECPNAVINVDTLTEADGCNGTTISYQVDITGSYTDFRIDFGDGSFTTTQTSGEHTYKPNTEIDPVVRVSNNKCQVIQTPIFRDTPTEPQIEEEEDDIFIRIPDIDIPDILIPDCVIPEPTMMTPPAAGPCLGSFPDINIPSNIFGEGGLGDFNFPSKIEIDDVNIPSHISFDDINIPSHISIDDVNIPSFIDFGDVNIPSFIEFGDVNIPSFIDFGDIYIPSEITIIGEIPSLITIIGEIPSEINIIGEIPSTISLILDIPDIVSFVGCNLPSIIDVNVSTSIINVVDTIPETITLDGEVFLDAWTTAWSTAWAIAAVQVTGLRDIFLLHDLPEVISMVCCVPSNISVEWGEPPMVSVAWGTPPTVSIICGSSGASFNTQSYQQRASYNEKNDPIFDMQIEPEMLFNIPSEIELITKLENIKVVHDIPSSIAIESPNIPEIIRILQEIPIPSEINIKHDLPSEIRIIGEIPSSIELNWSSNGIIEIVKPHDFPSEIFLNATSVPTEIQIVGFSSVIEIKGNIPSEIIARLTLPEGGIKIPLVFEGPPIPWAPVPMKFDPTTPGSADAPCFALVPCGK